MIDIHTFCLLHMFVSIVVESAPFNCWVGYSETYTLLNVNLSWCLTRCLFFDLLTLLFNFKHTVDFSVNFWEFIFVLLESEWLKIYIFVISNFSFNKFWTFDLFSIGFLLFLWLVHLLYWRDSIKTIWERRLIYRNSFKCLWLLYDVQLLWIPLFLFFLVLSHRK